MRRDYRPFWVHQLQSKCQSAWVKHFIQPQLDGCGVGLEVIGPRHFKVSGPSIYLGQDVHVMALPEAPVRLSVFEEMGRIEVADYTLINPGARVTSAERISIGEGCMLAMHTSINDADWHDVQHRIFAPGATAPVVLERNVWLGEGTRVLKGVTIGENTVVGAGSVVSRSLPANVIAVGNPARVIKPLPDGEGTTRADLFNMDIHYAQFADEFMRERLKGNNFLSWLGSFLFPRRFD